MIVAWANSSEYVFMSYDALVLAPSPGARDGWEPAPAHVLPPRTAKVLKASTRVLAATTGRLLAGDYFDKRLAELVGGTDDLDTCHAAAKCIVHEIWDGKGPDPRGLKLSGFGYILAGFYGDGVTGLAGCASEDDENDAAFYETRSTDNPNPALPVVMTAAVPYGLESSAVEPFFCIHPERIAAESSLANAFWRAWNIHHALGNDRPDRVSEKFSVSALFNAGLPDGLVYLNADGDRRDVQWASGVFHQLGAMAPQQRKRRGGVNLQPAT